MMAVYRAVQLFVCLSPDYALGLYNLRYHRFIVAIQVLLLLFHFYNIIFFLEGATVRFRRKLRTFAI